MPKWLRNSLVALGILGVASASAPDLRPVHPDCGKSTEEFVVLITHKCELGEKDIMNVAGDFKVYGGWNSKGTVVFSGGSGQEIRMPKNANIGRLDIGNDPTGVVLIGDLLAEETTINRGSKFTTGIFKLTTGDLTVSGELDKTGGAVEATGDVTFAGSGYVITGMDVPLDLRGGTGHKLTIVTPATYSGSEVLTGTKTTFHFSSHLRQDPHEKVIPARYGPVYSSTGMVITATGAVHTATGVQLFRPSLGTVLF